MSNYQTFPWLGIYMYTLALNARKGFTPFLFSILSFVVLFYCMFLTAVLIWNELLFKKSFPNGITDKFYTLVAYFEVLNLLFIRTRSSIKYFPIGIMTILFFWSFYFQVAIYPFAFISLYLATSACATVFCYLIVYFEIPALTWNPNHTYTPSVHKPRQVFFPAFSLNWVHDLPQFWNMFFPLWGRGQFTNNQLALVDNDMGLLNNTLQNANNLNIGSADDEQLMNHLDLQAAAAPPSSPSPRIQECSTKGSAASRQMFSSQLQYPFAPEQAFNMAVVIHKVTEDSKEIESNGKANVTPVKLKPIKIMDQEGREGVVKGHRFVGGSPLLCWGGGLGVSCSSALCVLHLGCLLFLLTFFFQQ
eukprot:TRINITY_DN1861_c0_g1_i11.p1 TRINITY_DN1861_c0_g1~~TRINITY_DN1861_c0_g1_i11.p1  ORF type:complete len:361 (-),score=69.81 TRINITY_DN1861_c0_g1_i11:237-1319(-)